MYTKILSCALAVWLLLAQSLPALAQQIPAGYALVPLTSLTTPSPAASPAEVASISPAKSTLRAAKEIGYVGDKIRFTATLRDTAGRPLADRPVHLISSRANDRITALSATTNNNGEAVFVVTAATEGIGSFTALDQSSGAAVNERPKLVFLRDTRSAIGGDSALLGTKSKTAAASTTKIAKPKTSNLLRSDLAAATEGEYAAAYDQQLSANFPESVPAGEPTDLVLGVLDLDGNAVEDFAGTVSFTSTDTEAILPTDYTFVELDRGVHTFAHAVTFQTPGTQTIYIETDAAAEPIELTVTVTGDTAGGETPVIKSPVDGFITNQAVKIEGSSLPNINLAVLIDDSSAGEITTNETGRFSAELSLEEGEYNLKVATLQLDGSVGAVSEPVAVTVDKTPPELIKLGFGADETITLGETVKVTVKSEAGLGVVKIKSGEEEEIELKEAKKEGVYSGELAITLLGKLLFDVELVDAAGNSTLEAEAGTLLSILPITIHPVAEAKNKRVDLSWDNPANHEEIDHYEVKYGTLKDKLDQTFTTTDNRTAWYIGDLNNDTTYYFEVYSLDANGMQNGKSEVISAVPTSQIQLTATVCDSKVKLTWLEPAKQEILRYKVSYGLESGNYTESRELPLESRNTWEVRNLINGLTYYFTITGLDQAGQEVFAPDEEVAATPGGAACHGAAPAEPPIQLWQKRDDKGKITLSWNPVPGAASYVVYAGNLPNSFNLPAVTVSTPYYQPTKLIANEKYYFAVRAVYPDGRESMVISNTLEIEVGPAELLALAIVIALGTSFWLRRRDFLGVKVG